MPVGVTVTLDIPNVTTDMLTWDSIRLYRASSRTGTYSLITTITLVAAQAVYTYQDTTGSSTSWYRWSYFNSGSSTESSQGDPFPGGGSPAVTWLSLLRRVQQKLEMFAYPPKSQASPGPSGTTTGAGSTTTVVCASYVDSRLSTRSYRDWYLRMVVAADERRVDSFDPTTGTFTLAGPLSASSGNTKDFDLYAYMPYQWWTERLSRAALNVQLPFEYVFGGVVDQREYALPWFVQDRTAVQSVTYRFGREDVEWYTAQPLDCDVLNLEQGGVSLYIPGGLAAEQLVTVRGTRSLGPYSADTDTVTLSEYRQELLIYAAAAAALENLAIQQGGSAEDRAYWERRLKYVTNEAKGIAREVNPVRKVAPIRRNRWASISGDGALDL